ncbi:phosphate ABC transporter substrate-binding protein [Streptomyces sp. uw30]|uniref:substrate-binding domain-containing protein n=1 Tax=Streptomyces sp. uw30 TaxID=1828179 RepID=UPI0011CE9AEF|nr:substrate-binding domain-containing protein [Streptomyces sp. uw30]TXS35192.1 phosphate ABC transporter substrate-binding protein [Streptomyces sp. uw30]
MEWLSAENVVAVGTAVLGVVASGVMVWYERRVPRRKRIGYRVQMDNPIGYGVRSGRAGGPPSGGVRLGLFDADMDDATLVLLRVENDGSQTIDRDDYTDPGPRGLTAVFTDRTIRGVSVTQPTDIDHLMDHFTEERGFGYEGNRLRIPRVPLNPGDYFKLLVLLSGGDVGSDIRLRGGIRNGEVHPNRSATPDDKAPVFSLQARIFTGLLTLSVLALAGIVVFRDGNPIECEQGELTVIGSTAFEPVISTLAKQYEGKCAGAEIDVQTRGSESGVAELAALADRSKSRARSVIAFSDGPLGDRLGLKGKKVALSVFTLAVNDGIDLGPDGLSVQQVRDIYKGRYKRWGEVIPGAAKAVADLPIVLVSRSDTSGTRQVFQDRVLGGWEQTQSTSLDCRPPKGAATVVTRCELASTGDVLDKIADQPGAIGYSELSVAAQHKGVTTVPLDGDRADVDEIERGDSAYPYRDIEYAYTYGIAPNDSLTAGFLAYLDKESSRQVIRTQGHLPCGTPVGLKLCG